MCIFSILFLQWWLVSWYFSFCSGNHVLASIKILFSMTNKTPCSPPQYMQGRFWFEYYKACPGCEHRWSRCGRGHWVATGAVSLLVMPGTDPPQPASYSQPQTTSQFIGAMEIQNDGDKAAHSRKSRTKPVHFRLEKVRIVDTSDNFR